MVKACLGSEIERHCTLIAIKGVWPRKILHLAHLVRTILYFGSPSKKFLATPLYMYNSFNNEDIYMHVQCMCAYIHFVDPLPCDEISLCKNILRAVGFKVREISRKYGMLQNCLARDICEDLMFRQ